MINGVSFGAISTDPTIKLQDSTIAQPSNNSAAPAPSTTNAATDVKGDKFEKKGKGGKVAFGIFATAAATLTALALLVSKGKLSQVVAKDGEVLKFIQKAQNIACTVGQKTLDIATDCITKAKGLFHHAGKEGGDAVGGAT